LTAVVVDGASNELVSLSIVASQAGGWVLATLPLVEAEESYTGDVTVEICLEDPPNATSYDTVFAYVDDVSLGRGAGGPYHFNVPLVFPGQ
ncbi:MAG: hypothetical protein ACYC5O_15985, partial [Anaerolineae bacterium]